jgi:hypothetical protein
MSKEGTLLVTIAQKALEDAANIIGSIKILEESNKDNANESLNKVGAGAAAGQIHLALIWRLQSIVVRAYLKPVKSDDLHLRHGFELLKNEITRVNSIAHGAHDSLQEAEQLWLRNCGDHRLEKLIATRHKFIAHLGEPDKNLPMPSYKDLFDFGRETATMMEHFAKAIGVTIEGGLEGENTKFEKSAQQYWKPWKQ